MMLGVRAFLQGDQNPQNEIWYAHRPCSLAYLEHQEFYKVIHRIQAEKELAQVQYLKKLPFFQDV